MAHIYITKIYISNIFTQMCPLIPSNVSAGAHSSLLVETMEACSPNSNLTQNRSMNPHDSESNQSV